MGSTMGEKFVRRGNVTVANEDAVPGGTPTNHYLHKRPDTLR